MLPEVEFLVEKMAHVNAAICLCASCAMPGTDVRYGATRCRMTRCAWACAREDIGSEQARVRGRRMEGEVHNRAPRLLCKVRV